MKDERFVKRVTPSGKAGGIYVPKQWINRRVVVKLLSAEDYVVEALRPYQKDIVGAYLYGPAARGKADADSDIDVFIVSRGLINLPQDPLLNVKVIPQDRLRSFAEENPHELRRIMCDAVPLFDSRPLEKTKAGKYLSPNKVSD